MANIMKTGVLLAALTVLVVLIGGALGGQQGMVMAFVLAMAMNLGSYWFSDKIVLAMYGAQPVDEASAPELYREGPHAGHPRRHPDAAGLHHPGRGPERLRHRPQPEHAAVAVTEGIMRILTTKSWRASWPTSSLTSRTATRSS